MWKVFYLTFLFLEASVNFLDEEYFVIVQPIMNGQLAGLAKRLVASRVLAFVGLVSCVHIQVIFEILGQGKTFATVLARETSVGVMD